ncbi:16S rRNA (uracil(1498)-N(3))-methyltransferase [Amycolatopsis suaedae]|uniref:Ribosomal RNA small subunit methyltransferase E n=1 Tax=Amycolatopsis suaedae TaxID=2510978 RepID=A0A4Q7J309_9PSEU|nr:16S rRNA (uracil(1498)-N(3))-methyltransferase [Amycolatopsis suaedae]RZQ60364.1 16S rRNA (uracil(1498)-N(3))-methyltransferase [Amycolatopsis suaedae]
MSGTTPPVFLVDRLPAGETTVLDGDEARHAATVRRLRPGETLVLTDGAGELAECVVDTVRPGRDATLGLTVGRRWHEARPEPQVVLAQGLIKGDRGELAVELATEAGVDAVLPWQASRSIARWDDGPRGDKALARWRATARAAAKQARRGRLPEVSPPVGTAGLADRVRAAAAALVLDATADTRLADAELPRSGELVLVVGPEGGITADELRTLTEAGARPVRLGPTVLRASTAGAVALGALGAITDRWS